MFNPHLLARYNESLRGKLNIAARKMSTDDDEDYDAAYAKAMAKFREQASENLTTIEKHLYDFRVKFGLPYLDSDKYLHLDKALFINKATCLEAIGENPMRCQYDNVEYKEETLSYFTAIKRKFLKSKISTIGDLIDLVKRIVKHLCKEKPNSLKLLLDAVTDFCEVYDSRDKNPNEFDFFNYVDFCVLLHALGTGIKKLGVVRKCFDYGVLNDGACDDLQLLVDLTDISQACDGMIEKKILGLMYKRIQFYPNTSPVNFRYATLLHLDISSGLAHGIENKSTYLEFQRYVEIYRDAAFSRYDINEIEDTDSDDDIDLNDNVKI